MFSSNLLLSPVKMYTSGQHPFPATIYFSTKLITAQSLLLTTLRKKVFENIVGKGENAGNQHFLFFPQCFQPKSNFSFLVAFTLSSANAFNLDRSKILLFGKELTHYHTIPHFDTPKIYSCGKHCEKRRNCL